MYCQKERRFKKKCFLGKSFAALLICFISFLSGCSFISKVAYGENIKTLENWSFQYNEGTDDYSLFFGLNDEKGKSIAADVDVNIRIVNDQEEVIFEGSKVVKKDDFDYYTSKAAGERYLANVKIKSSEIVLGKSSNGTVYFTVYKENYMLFDEVHCGALYCLPLKDVQLESGPFPIDLEVKGYDGGVKSIIQVDNVSYIFEKNISPQMKIIVEGTKTYDGKDSVYTIYDKIDYKLYDSGGYMVKSGVIFLNSLSQGDKFKDDSIVIYDIIPGETYTLQLEESDW